MRRRNLLALFLCALSVAEARIWVVAHRGAKNEAPENTIPAYARAVELGADYIEVDVRSTTDGALVIMHDPDVERTTTGKGAVAAMTLGQILSLDAGVKFSLRFAGTRIPTFAETLAFARKSGVRVDVDHKAGGVEPIARAIREADMTDRVVIEGGPVTLPQFARSLPGVATMPTVRCVADVAEVCRRLKTTVVRLSLSQLDDAALVDAVHRAGAQVSITILGRADNEETMRRTIRLGADIIETDSTALLVRVRQSLSGH